MVMILFFFLQMENYFLICCETDRLTVPGKMSSISLNSLLITLDGFILLVVWPGFLKIKFFFHSGRLSETCKVSAQGGCSL